MGLIDNSYLLGLFGMSSSTTSGLGATGASVPKPRTQPTAPWSTTVEAPEPSALLRAALGGRKLINESQAKVDLGGTSADYRKLFALYNGLESLNALVNRAGTKGVPASELSLIDKRFTAGMAELSGWMQTAELEGVRLTQGVTASLSKSTAAIQRDSAQSLTGAIHEGRTDQVVKAFEGDVSFTISVTKLRVTTDVDIDLAEMGGQTRSLDNVLRFINGKLEDAGVATRIGREQIAAQPKTVQVGDKTVTLPSGADRWALMIRGSVVEDVSFSAPEENDAIYVTQGAGTAGGHQFLKFDAEGGGASRIGETHWVDGRVSQTNLPEGVETIRASATAPDGSVWVLGDLSAGGDNQPIKGQRDVALMRFDSAGRLMMTRTLGAADTASGFALAVGADGRVAVAGSVTGGLAVTGSLGALTGKLEGDDAKVADSFVTVFDAEGGELWTQRRGARAEDEATAVSFAADGTVVVAGRARSAMPGGGPLGNWDGYIQTFSQHQAHPVAPVTARLEDIVQFGTAGEDSVAAVTVSGSSVYAASVENGRAVVRQYALSGTGQLTLSATRDLGAISGDIAGIMVEDGRVVIAGTTRNGALGGVTAAAAHSGGTDAFVLSLDASLTAGSGDRVTYLGGEGDDTVADVKLHDGQVWVTGQHDRPIGAKDDAPRQAYLASVNLSTGAVASSRTWKGDGDQAAPASLAIASNGASVLDRLGLPQGTIDQSASKRLVDGTSLRVGDQFTIAIDGGRPRTVTIEARDTLQTLARKIEQASQMRLRVTVASEGGYVTGTEADGETRTTAGGWQRLSISARSGRDEGATLSAGPGGRDALAGLGVSPGYIGPTSSEDDDIKTYGLDLPATLSLSTAETIKAAGERIQAAMKAIRDAYRALAPETAANANRGPAPAYLTAQIANYQAALSRLTGGM
ncbi:transcriptional regulator [Brevundimonas sp.]|uniref:transcriptional regulator n=1 Tax=Brevundimonas sp. TaxID=1871086 RepID=UPI0035B1F5F0